MYNVMKEAEASAQAAAHVRQQAFNNSVSSPYQLSSL
jgi:hypothetical protein